MSRNILSNYLNISKAAKYINESIIFLRNGVGVAKSFEYGLQGIAQAFGMSAAAAEAFSAVVVSIAPYLLAIGAALVVLDAVTVSFDEAAKKAEESKKAYEQTQNEIQNLNSELETTQQRIDELQAKGSLNLVEQEELARLQETNKSLERRIELLEAIRDVQGRGAAEDANAALNTAGFTLWEQGGGYKNSFWNSVKYGLGQDATNPARNVDIIEYVTTRQQELNALTAQYNRLRDEDPTSPRLESYEQQIGILSSELSGLYDDIMGWQDSISGYDEFSDTYERIETLWALMETEASKAADAQQKVNDVLSRPSIKNAVEDAKFLAKELNGIDATTLEEQFPEIAAAARVAGVEIEDVVNSINSAVGTVNFDEIRQQLLALKPGNVGVNEWWEFVNKLEETDLVEFFNLIKNAATEGWDFSDVISAFAEMQGSAEDAADGVEKSLDSISTSASNVVSGISSIKDAISSQTTGKSITAETFNADGMKDYASALEYVNGSLQYNIEKVNELVAAKSEEELAVIAVNKANRQETYLANAAKIEELRKKLLALTDSQGASKASIESQIQSLLNENSVLSNECTQFDLMSASIREATSAYQNWINAQSAAESGDMFDGSLSALKLIEQTLNDTDFENFGKVGRTDYKAAVDFLIPDTIDREDTDAINRYIDSIADMFTTDSNGNRDGLNIGAFVQKSLDAGLLVFDEVSGDYRIAGEKTMQDFADGLGLSLPLVQAMFGELQEYGVEFDWADEAIQSLEDLQVAAVETRERLIALGIEGAYGILLDTSNVDTAEEKVAILEDAIANLQALDIEADSEAAEYVNSLIANCQSQIAAINDTTMEPDVDSSEVDAFVSANHDVRSVVKYSVNATSVYNWTAPTKYGKVVYREAQATGTAQVHGAAAAGGNWGTATGGKTLVGEIGREIVVEPRTGRWYTVGDNGPEFKYIPAGSIVFNNKQSEALLQYGHIPNEAFNALAQGTAMVTGGAGLSAAISAQSKKYPSSSSGGYSSTKSSGYSTSSSTTSKTSTNEDTWYEKQYKYHQHLLAMEQESVEDYIDWLDWAYQKAYNEGILELEDFYSAQEEVFDKLREVFEDYLGDIEHNIDMREAFGEDTKTIISLYRKLMSDIEKELKAAYAAGLDDNNDYVQRLQSQWVSYRDTIVDLQQDIIDAAKDALDRLIDYRIDMMKQDVNNDKDALNKKLDNLKEFYDKQKRLLQDVHDEEKYLDEQSEKRRSVTDIQAQIARLEYDDSAWAQKRKLELRAELADAQKELDDFEKEHALDTTLNLLEQSYNEQEAQIQKEMDALEEVLNDPEALYNAALEDIRKNGETQLYYQMLEYNRKYGTGNDETVNELWESVYGSLNEYQKLLGKLYKEVSLADTTGVSSQPATSDNSGYENSPISPAIAADTTPATKPTTTETTTPAAPVETKPAAPSLYKGATVTVKAGHRWYAASDGTGSSGYSSYNKTGTIKAINTASWATHPYLINNWGWVKKSDIVGYQTGTANALPGLHGVDELGPEYLFTSSDGSRYRVFSGGEKVLNAKATEFLYDFANNGREILSKMAKGLFDGASLDKVQPICNNNEINMGDVIVQGNADRATISEIRRAQRDSLETMLREFNRLNK